VNTRYPQDKCLHIFTDGSQIEGYINAGAGISSYVPLGQHSTAFDGEIEAIRSTLCVLNFHHNKSERAVIFSDSKAAILSAASTETKISTEARDCQDLIRKLKGKQQTDRTAVDTRTLPNYREPTSRRTGQKGRQNYTNIYQRNTPTTLFNYILSRHFEAYTDTI